MNRTILMGLAWVTGAVLAAPAAAQVSLGTCPNDAYVSRADTSSLPVQLYSMNLATGVLTLIGPANPSTSGMRDVNGIGFRSQDGFVWGWNTSAKRLAKIGVNGVTTLNSTYPTGLTPAGLDFYTADVQPSTGYYVGSNGANLYFINVETNSLVRTLAVGTTFSDSTDMAFSPIDGQIYTVRGSSGTLVRVDPVTGTSVDVATNLVPTVGAGGFGGLFFDSQGTLYAYKSNSGGADGGYLYRIFNPHTSAPSYDLLSRPPSSGRLDSARCPTAPPQGAPAILLNKVTSGAAGGPFSFQLTHTSHTSGSVSTAAADAATQVDGDPTRAGLQPFTVLNASLGQPLTITETALPVGWKLSAMACTLNGNPVGSADLANRRYTLPGSVIATGNSFLCTFENSRLQADLAVTKTADPATPVAVGATMTYTLVVKNNGPDPVTGAVVTDTPDAAGLDCPDSAPVTCSATPQANCPTGALTLGELKAGITLPTLANGAEARFSFSCTVQ